MLLCVCIILQKGKLISHLSNFVATKIKTIAITKLTFLIYVADTMDLTYESERIGTEETKEKQKIEGRGCSNRVEFHKLYIDTYIRSTTLYYCKKIRFLLRTHTVFNVTRQLLKYMYIAYA